MKKHINLIFDKINEIIAKNKNFYNQGNSILISSLLFEEKYRSLYNVTTCIEQQKVFLPLKENKKNPILYWFTIDDKKTNAIELRKKYIEFKQTKSTRASASYKPYVAENSKTLYVGKVKKDFHLRLVTHLGYSKNERTAGMQLFHWFNPEVFGNLSLNYIVFNEEMSDLITILEMELARELKPIIGKY
jgi:hypothetical protein